MIILILLIVHFNYNLRFLSLPIIKPFIKNITLMQKYHSFLNHIEAFPSYNNNYTIKEKNIALSLQFYFKMILNISSQSIFY